MFPERYATVFADAGKTIPVTLVPAASHIGITLNLETGWPKGLPGVMLVITGNVTGYFLGTYAADNWFGWSSWDSGPSTTPLRNSILITALAGIAIFYYFYSVNKSAAPTSSAKWMRRASTRAKRA